MGEVMLKACSGCGRIHKKGECDIVAVYSYKRKNESQAQKFRNRKVWRRKADEILERDYCCCRLCLMAGVVNSENLSVHHIIPLVQDFDKRLDNDNLITLCRYHHELAERGMLKKSELHRLACERVDFSRNAPLPRAFSGDGRPTPDLPPCKQSIPDIKSEFMGKE